MEHIISYELARALHIIAVIAWIAGLLMLPRFYAYISGSEIGGELERTMIKAAHNLRAIILGPALIASWVFGLFTLITYVLGDLSRPDLAEQFKPWLVAKLILVLGLSGYQGFLFGEGRRLAQGQRRHSERFWRIMSEVPFLVAIAVVLLVMLKPGA